MKQRNLAYTTSSIFITEPLSLSHFLWPRQLELDQGWIRKQTVSHIQSNHFPHTTTALLSCQAYLPGSLSLRTNSLPEDSIKSTANRRLVCLPHQLAKCAQIVLNSRNGYTWDSEPHLEANRKYNIEKVRSSDMLVNKTTLGDVLRSTKCCNNPKISVDKHIQSLLLSHTTIKWGQQGTQLHAII